MLITWPLRLTVLLYDAILCLRVSGSFISSEMINYSNELGSNIMQEIKFNIIIYYYDEYVNKAVKSFNPHVN